VTPNDIILTEMRKMSRDLKTDLSREFRSDLLKISREVQSLRADFEGQARKAEGQLTSLRADFEGHARKADKGQEQLNLKIDRLNKTTTKIEKNVGNLFANARIEWLSSVMRIWFRKKQIL